MNGHNAQFIARPDLYIRQWTINNVSSFIERNNPGIATQITNIAAARMGSFDLVPQQGVNSVDFKPAFKPVVGDMPITAYWLPFPNGNVLPGYIDIPLVDPPYPLVFTVAMNGCALVATQSPKGDAYIRVYHDNHPLKDGSLNAHIASVGQPLRSQVVYRDYAGVDDKIDSGTVNAFAFLFYTDGRWRYMFQPQVLLPDLKVIHNTRVEFQTKDV